MKKYYALNYFAGDGDCLIDADVKFTPAGSDYYDLESTEVGLFSKIEFQLDPGIEYQDEDFFRTTSGVFLGSSALCEILKQYQSDVECVQALGRYADGRAVTKTYQLIHPGKRIDALDYHLSAYAGKNLILSERASGKATRMVKGISKPVIDPSQAANNHYFFLANTLYFHPIISEDLLNAFIKKNIKISYQAL